MTDHIEDERMELTNGWGEVIAIYVRVNGIWESTRKPPQPAEVAQTTQTVVVPEPLPEVSNIKWSPIVHRQAKSQALGSALGLGTILIVGFITTVPPLITILMLFYCVIMLVCKEVTETNEG
jgi:hypothetical protein